MRLPSCLALPLAVALCFTGLSAGQVVPRAATAQAAPHAWLFGSWTGGLFPVPANLPNQACLQQPVVIFTRDVVLRASITDQLYSQRLIETARTSTGATEFRFTPVAAPATEGGLLGLTAQPVAAGFGCENANVLHVVRKSENEITFPGCADFPNPLVRCSGR